MKKLSVFLMFCLAISTATMAQSGQLDSLFGTDGLVLLEFDDYARANAVAVQPDGNILVGGEVYKHVPFHDTDMLMLRYLPDGSLDTSFGQGGQVQTDLNNYESLHHIAVQPDGKIIAAGHESNRLLVCRYLHNGTPDLDFGDAGCRVAGFEVTYGGFALQPDGKILLAGYGFDPDTSTGLSQLVYRLDEWGNPDTSFANDGVAVTSFGDYTPISDLLLKPDGKILLNGLTTNNGVCSVTDIAVIQLMPDGSLDNGFGGGDGYALFDRDSLCDGSNISTLFSDGESVLLTGWTDTDSVENVPFLLKMTSEGALDTLFSNDGWSFIGDGFAYFDARDAIFLPNDKFLFAGTAVIVDTIWGSPTEVSRAMISRFLPNGSIDSTFGIQGSVLLNTDFTYPFDIWNSLTLGLDNSLFVVGGNDGSGKWFVLAKYKLDITSPTREQRATGSKIPLRIYPNPASTIATFSVQLPLPSPVRLELLDAFGRLVFTKQFPLQPSGIFSLQLELPASLPGGAYLAQLKGDGVTATTILLIAN
ncbi:MAG: hypothetical protein AAB316_08660 [Bacteroidota bacterium]